MGKKMQAMLRLMLALFAVLVVVNAAVPLENPLTEADDMLTHFDMENGPHDLGESMGGDDDREEDVFDMPTTEDALDQDAALKNKDKKLMDALGSDAPIDEELLMKSGALSEEEKVEAKLKKAVREDDPLDDN